MNKISEKGLSIIKKYEGLRLQSYLCPAEKWTIGYGHTRSAHANMSITEEQADELLLQDVRLAENSVNKHVQVEVTDSMFDAMVSLAFNIGNKAFIHSTLVRKINEKRYDLAAKEFDRWIFAGGKEMEGLKRRRLEEKTLFVSEGLTP